jgi:hypothetical protein
MASQQYTKVETPDSEAGYCCNGYTTRTEAIAQARWHYEQQLEKAKLFLSTPDDELHVYQCTGLYRENNIRVLED